jgi:hypothetical protein
MIPCFPCLLEYTVNSPSKYVSKILLRILLVHVQFCRYLLKEICIFRVATTMKHASRPIIKLIVAMAEICMKMIN